MLGTTEIVLIGAMILVLFGASAIPKFFHSLGKAKHEFQKGLAEGDDRSDSQEAETTPVSGVTKG